MKSEIIIMSRTRRHFTSKFKSNLVIESAKVRKRPQHCHTGANETAEPLWNWKNESSAHHIR